MLSECDDYYTRNTQDTEVQLVLDTTEAFDRVEYVQLCKFELLNTSLRAITARSLLGMYTYQNVGVLWDNIIQMQ